MTQEELIDLVQQGESQSLEFKKTTGQRQQAVKTICAFLNAKGGTVLFGVSDKGEIPGQLVSSRTLEDLAREFKLLDPSVSPGIDMIPLKNGHLVVVVNVKPRDGAGPYTFDGRPYERVGSTTAVMAKSVYENLLLEKLQPSQRWESLPAPGNITIADLDTEEIERVISDAVRIGRMEAPRHMDPEAVLLGLELIHDDRLLNAAVILFGQNVGVQFPQCEIRLARFRGSDKQPDFSDNRQYKGHAFNLLHRAENFLMDHVQIAGQVIPGEMVRQDKPWYPPRATREALANAICHRDYTMPGAAVSVGMYNDRLEIANPGDLHFGLTPDKLKLPHESRPWNPLIANTFFRAGIIERWGSGTTNIVHWCEENGNPSPQWQVRAGSVVVIFSPPAEVKTKSQAIDPHVTPHVTPHVEKLIQCCQNPSSRSELQQRMGVKDRKHFRETYLIPAFQAGLIEYTIPDKPKSTSQKYKLTAKGLEWQRGKTEGMGSGCWPKAGQPDGTTKS